VLSAVAIRGLTPVATRYVVATLSPALLLVLRFSIASLMLLPFALRLSWSRIRAQARLILVAGLLGVAGYNVPVTVGLQWAPSSTAGLILASEPALILLFSWLIARESLPPFGWVGTAVSFSGVALLSTGALTSDGPSGHRVVGLALVLAAAGFFAAYSVCLRPVSRSNGAAAATAVTTVAGALPLLLLVPAVRPDQLLHLNASSWTVVGLLAAGSTVVAMVLWSHGVFVMGAARASPYLYLVPLVSLAGGTILLGEHPAPTVLAGGALILAGVALSHRGSRRRISSSSTADTPEASALEGRPAR